MRKLSAVPSNPLFFFFALKHRGGRGKGGKERGGAIVFLGVKKDEGVISQATFPEGNDVGNLTLIAATGACASHHVCVRMEVVGEGGEGENMRVFCKDERGSKGESCREIECRKRPN